MKDLDTGTIEHVVEAKHYSTNPASGRVMEKAGMIKDAVLKERRYHAETDSYCDLVCYSIVPAIARIRQMESYMNEVAEYLKSCQSTEYTIPAHIYSKVQALADYQGSGLWREDYELDEAGALPSDLKRGVLSEDGLYNLLMDAKELMH